MKRTKMLWCLILLPLLANAEPSKESKQWCLSKGGSIQTYEMLDERRLPTGITTELCEFHIEGEGTKHVGLETLYADHETIATQVFKVGYNKEKLPTNTNHHPGYNFCIKQGGSDATWKSLANGGETGLCEFSDESLMSDWTLFYGAKRLPKLARTFRYSIN